jgi:hypothetical protein
VTALIAWRAYGYDRAERARRSHADTQAPALEHRP